MQVKPNNLDDIGLRLVGPDFLKVAQKLADKINEANANEPPKLDANLEGLGKHVDIKA